MKHLLTIASVIIIAMTIQLFASDAKVNNSLYQGQISGCNLTEIDVRWETGMLLGEPTIKGYIKDEEFQNLSKCIGESDFVVLECNTATDKFWLKMRSTIELDTFLKAHRISGSPSWSKMFYKSVNGQEKYISEAEAKKIWRKGFQIKNCSFI